MTTPSRRDFLHGAVGAGLAALLPGSAAGQAPAPPRDAAGSFRFVHLSDIHIEPELSAPKGLAQCLRAVHDLKQKPDFILTGGDLVFDVLEASPQRAKELFELYKKVLADNTDLAVHNTLGNHDVFGWMNRDGVTPKSPGYGKSLAKDLLRLAETYYEFEHKGWRFFVLDNVQPAADPAQIYEGGLDRPQMEWLAGRLKRCKPGTPIAICEHIPMMTVTAFAFPGTYKQNKWEFSNSLVCGDTVERLKLYADHNVRLCLSGHVHQLDRIEYRGMTVICDGAVCGNWWKGPREGVKEGFGVLDLWPDGRVEHHYQDYGWKAGA